MQSAKVNLIFIVKFSWVHKTCNQAIEKLHFAKFYNMKESFYASLVFLIKLQIDFELSFYTLFEIFIFRPKIQLWFPEKIVDFFLGWKNRENVGGLDFLAVDSFDFTRKIVKKNLGEKLVKMFFVKIDFLDKNLTFRIAW